MIKQEFLYINNKFEDSKRAVIVLPEIYGVTDFIENTVDKFADKFEALSFGLDFFYQLNMKPNKLDYKGDIEKAMGLMNQMGGEDFINIFNKSVDLIFEEYPNIQELIVCGFCFGGRLAFLSGVNPKVNKIISFYGAGSNKPFYKGKSAIDNLCEARESSKDLKVIGFFGTQDHMIPKEDSDLTLKKLDEAQINYIDRYFDTGHAFFNHDREMYSETSAKQAWEIIHTFVSLPIVI